MRHHPEPPNITEDHFTFQSGTFEVFDLLDLLARPQRQAPRPQTAKPDTPDEDRA